MITLVGGNFEEHKYKESKVVTKLAKELFDESKDSMSVFNGGRLEKLQKISLTQLSIWMPNISNEHEKQYPKKAIGCCLICSKVVRPEQINNSLEHKFTEATKRIYKMQANAVIAIEKGEKFKFTLIDALGNIWVSTENLNELAKGILSFYQWHLKQERKSLKQNNNTEKFLKIVRNTAEKTMVNSGMRYFGNCSTRCAGMFPSKRLENDVFLFSARNTNKIFIDESDLVLVSKERTCFSKKKPSVDTVVQLELYKNFKKINYMIHGHAFFKDERIKTTTEYFPCGDLREINEITNAVGSRNVEWFLLNLKNHGFIIATNTLENMEKLLDLYKLEIKPFRQIK